MNTTYFIHYKPILRTCFFISCVYYLYLIYCGGKEEKETMKPETFAWPNIMAQHWRKQRDIVAPFVPTNPNAALTVHREICTWYCTPIICPILYFKLEYEHLGNVLLGTYHPISNYTIPLVMKKEV